VGNFNEEINVVAGMALSFGGLAQILAGMWAFAVGNTFLATVFTSYGGFWLSFAAILIPGTGIMAAYQGNTDHLGPALGVYLMSWVMMSIVFFVGSLKHSVVLAAVFFFLFMDFLLFSVSELHHSLNLHRGAGGMGIASALCAYYMGAASLFAADNGIKLPIFPLA
jgi:succinate-acetate transporter protein